ncbi:hypothetical protein DF051_34985 [Burkholderia contaminans]|uniref:Uncharacterized protein n=1 Tax=Burkholderia contaminans TaxID=488447 RepID=A0A3N8P3Q2_9BURK|nr:hypothetical protein DF051_34985 [Burkholderia contaminans]
MLTICRQFRSSKGARKPVVGPVACYRGVERVVVPIAYRGCGDFAGVCPGETAYQARTVGPAPLRHDDRLRFWRVFSTRQTVTQVTHYLVQKWGVRSGSWPARGRPSSRS